MPGVAGRGCLLDAGMRIMEVNEMKRFKDILCVVEPGEACKPVLPGALTLAENNQASLAPRRIYEKAGRGGQRLCRTSEAATSDTLNAFLRAVASARGRDVLDYLKPQTHLVKGRARKEIPALAKQIEADLVVMGTVARTGVPAFIMGDTAETILNQIGCSVLAIKPPGFATPVTLED
jgi:nucleotide-binding universal stress UspA family protein